MIQHAWFSNSPFSNWEYLSPNQRTWTQTGEQIGANHHKRPQPTNPSPTALATKQIGLLNWKQLRIKNTDPYSGSLWSGKDATPDAQMATQNTKACTCDAAGLAHAL